MTATVRPSERFSSWLETLVIQEVLILGGVEKLLLPEMVD